MEVGTFFDDSLMTDRDVSDTKCVIEFQNFQNKLQTQITCLLSRNLSITPGHLAQSGLSSQILENASREMYTNKTNDINIGQIDMKSQNDSKIGS